MELLQPVSIEEMQKSIVGRSKQENEEETQFRICLVLGPDFPNEVADLYCAFAFKKGAIIERIPCTDPRTQAIEGGGYEGAPAGVIASGGKAQQVYLLKPNHVDGLDIIEAVNFFDYNGGTVTAMCCNADEVGRALEWGP